MLIDDNLALAYTPYLALHPSVVFRLDKKPEYVWFPDFLEARGVDIIEADLTERNSLCLNFVAVTPRQVLGFDWATRMADEITRRGGGATTVPGAELHKGNGGPHCMTCPLWRE